MSRVLAADPPSPFTILAFFFIPISLASSIFGMNVQEINNTGKGIWQFAVTAIVLTGLALGSWGLTNLGLRVRNAWKKRREPEGKPLWTRVKNTMWLAYDIWYPWSLSFMVSLVIGLVTDGRLGREEPSRYVDEIRKSRAANSSTRTSMERARGSGADL